MSPYANDNEGWLEEAILEVKDFLWELEAGKPLIEIKEEEDSVKQFSSDRIIPAYSKAKGLIYGKRVVVEPHCIINGSIIGREAVLIGQHVKITQSVLSCGLIELENSEVGNIYAPTIRFRAPINVAGDIVAKSNLIIPPGSRVKNIYCLGDSLELPERCSIDNVICKGAITFKPNTEVKGVAKAQAITLSPRCSVNALFVKSDLKIPPECKLNEIYSAKSVLIEGYANISKLFAEGDVEVNNSVIGKIACNNLLVFGETKVKKVYANNKVVIDQKCKEFTCECIVSNNDVIIPSNSHVKVVICSHNLTVGNNCTIDYIMARNITAGDRLRSKFVKAMGTITLGNDCKVGLLQAIGNITVGERFKSDRWSIFSEKGAIKTTGPVILKGRSIFAPEHLIEYNMSKILTALISKKDFELLQRISSKTKVKVN